MEKSEVLNILKTLASELCLGRAIFFNTELKKLDVVNALMSATHEIIECAAKVPVAPNTENKPTVPLELLRKRIKWTEEEDLQLEKEFKSGLSYEEISVIHSRTENAIRARLGKCIRPYFPFTDVPMSDKTNVN